MPAARFLPLAGCPEGFPLGQTGPFRAGFLGTKNTSGYPDQGTAGLVKALIKCRECHEAAVLGAASPAREPCPEAPVCRDGQGFDLLALIGQHRGKLPVLLPSLFLRPVEAAAQILNLVRQLFSFPVAFQFDRGKAFA